MSRPVSALRTSDSRGGPVNQLAVPPTEISKIYRLNILIYVKDWVNQKLSYPVMETQRKESPEVNFDSTNPYGGALTLGSECFRYFHPDDPKQ